MHRPAAHIATQGAAERSSGAAPIAVSHGQPTASAPAAGTEAARIRVRRLFSHDGRDGARGRTSGTVRDNSCISSSSRTWFRIAPDERAVDGARLLSPGGPERTSPVSADQARSRGRRLKGAGKTRAGLLAGRSGLHNAEFKRCLGSSEHDCRPAAECFRARGRHCCSFVVVIALR